MRRLAKPDGPAAAKRMLDALVSLALQRPAGRGRAPIDSLQDQEISP